MASKQPALTNYIGKHGYTTKGMTWAEQSGCALGVVLTPSAVLRMPGSMTAQSELSIYSYLHIKHKLKVLVRVQD